MKSNYQIAIEVIAGKWGVGLERRQRIEAAGYDYAAVQSIVNALMTDNPPEPVKGRLMKVELDLTEYDGLEVTITT